MLFTDQTLLTRIIEAYQARVPQLTDYNVGEIMLCLAEGDRDVAADLLFQAEAQLSRAMIDSAKTDDLETLLAGFGFSRQEAVSATVSLRLSVNDPLGYDLTIPAGTICSTVGNGDEEPIEFVTAEEVVLDGAESYIDAAATAVNGGKVGNVVANTIIVIVSDLPGVDAVTNSAAAAEGLDAWTDPEYRAAFRGWLGSLGKATPAAIAGRALQVPGVVSVHLEENQPSRGYNKLYIWSGSNSMVSDPIIQAVAEAIGDEYRGVGTTLTVLGAAVVPVSISLSLTARPGFELSSVRAAVVAALSRYLIVLPCAEEVRLSRAVQYAMQVAGVQDLEVTDIGGGGSGNLTINTDEVAAPGTISFA